MLPSPSQSVPLEFLEPVYQGQFGEFSINNSDRHGVRIYRISLLIAALCGGLGTLATIAPDFATTDAVPFTLPFTLLTWLYAGFSLALGLALTKIHIYLKVLHRALQVFWTIGTLSAVVLAAIAFQQHQSLALYVAHHPTSLLGLGFTFVALTGIFFKEAFCFNRLETKFLVAIVPSLLLGHLLGLLPTEIKKSLLIAWAVLFLIFALRKMVQNIPDDIGDKSVFEYLEKAKLEKTTSEHPEKTHGTAS